VDGLLTDFYHTSVPYSKPEEAQRQYVGIGDRPYPQFIIAIPINSTYEYLQPGSIAGVIKCPSMDIPFVQTPPAFLL